MLKQRHRRRLHLLPFLNREQTPLLGRMRPASWRAMHTTGTTGMSLGVCVPAPGAGLCPLPLPVCPQLLPSPAPVPPGVSGLSPELGRIPELHSHIPEVNCLGPKSLPWSFCKELTQTFLYTYLFQIIDPVCLVLREFFISSLQFGWCKPISPLKEAPSTGRFLLGGLRSS